jgi:hypothetical protein
MCRASRWHGGCPSPTASPERKYQTKHVLPFAGTDLYGQAELICGETPTVADAEQSEQAGSPHNPGSVSRAGSPANSGCRPYRRLGATVSDERGSLRVTTCLSDVAAGPTLLGLRFTRAWGSAKTVLACYRRAGAVVSIAVTAPAKHGGSLWRGCGVEPPQSMSAAQRSVPAIPPVYGVNASARSPKES